MAFTIEKDSSADDQCRMVIDEDMTIYTIDSLKQSLAETFELYINFELNLSGVEEIDSSGIQLLLALKREMVLRNKTFRLTSVSNEVVKLIDAYGIRDKFVVGEAL